MQPTHALKNLSYLLLILLLLAGASPTHSQSDDRPTVEAEAAIVVQHGAWQAVESNLASGGTFLQSSGSPADALNLRFEGGAVDIIALSGPGYGTLAIEIDKQVVRTVNLAAGEPAPQTIRIDYLSDAYHTLRLSSADGPIGIDAFITQPAAFIIDFSLHQAAFTPEMEALIYAELEEHPAALPAGPEFVVTAARIEEDAGQLFMYPRWVMERNYDVPDHEAVLIEVLLRRDASWSATLAGSGEYGAVRGAMSSSFLQSPMGGAAASNYLFPWSYGQAWYKTQGWHQGNAIDLAPAWSSSPYDDWAILAPEAGVVNETCNDGVQSTLQIEHADGTTRYLHMRADKVRDDLFGLNIAQGQYVGYLYDGTHHFSPVCSGGGWKWNTPCGCGTGAHTHWILPTRNMTIEGYSAESIAAAATYTQYTSHNVRIDDPDVCHLAALAVDETASGATSDCVQHWRLDLSSGNYYVDIERQSGNLEFDIGLQNAGQEFISSGATTGGDALYLIHAGTGYYDLKLYPRAGTSGNYQLRLKTGYPPQTTLASWDFSSIAGAHDWLATGQRALTGGFQADGWQLSLTDTTDPWLESIPLNLNVAGFDYLAVTMEVTTDAECEDARVYFATGDYDFSEARSVGAPIYDGHRQTYYFDMDSNAYWAGSISRLRLDPVDCGSAGEGDLLLQKIELADSTAPQKLIPLAPTGTQTDTNLPTYEWERDFYATDYYLYVADSKGKVFDGWFKDADCGATCAFTPDEPLLNNKTYHWWVISYDGSLWGEWTNQTTFALDVPPPATPTGLAADPNDGTPVFSWQDDPAIEWYQLYVQKNAQSLVLDKWIEKAAGLNCDGGTCQYASTLNLLNASYDWYLRGWGPRGYTEWAYGPVFHLTLTPPARPEASTFSVTDDGSPDHKQFGWPEQPNATWYHVYLNGASGKVYEQWVPGYEVCDAGQCAISPALYLLNGTYSMWLEAWGPGGMSPWSDGHYFTLAYDLPAPILGTSPQGSISDHTPTYLWEPDANAGWYFLKVENASTGQVVYSNWFWTPDVCNGSVCGTTPNLYLVEGGTYRWQVQGWGPGGLGDDGPAKTFTVQ
jgi:hypothetical protein